MRPDQRTLQVGAALDRDVRRRERAEAGRDSVRGPLRGRERFDLRARRGHRLDRIERQLDLDVVASDREYLLRGQRIKADDDVHQPTSIFTIADAIASATLSCHAFDPSNFASVELRMLPHSISTLGSVVRLRPARSRR